MRLLSVLFFASLCMAESDILLKPVKKSDTEVALVFVQGAQIENNAYLPLLTKIQEKSPFSLWIGSPHLPLDVANPLDIVNGVQKMVKDMRDAGMNTTTIFYSGHSLGGATLQRYVKSISPPATGQILMGSFIQRSQNYSGLGIPTLTIGGELDGLCRVTRLMESYYHQITNATDFDKAATSYPVIVVGGMNHFQFASGKPPALVAARDLESEISFEDAYEAVSTSVSNFMSVLVSGDPSAAKALKAKVAETGIWLRPLMAAFYLEGSYHLIKPCDTQGADVHRCQVGCPWTEKVAQITMGNLSTVTISDHDQFHEVWSMKKVHFPTIENTCKTEPGCHLVMDTVTEAVYDSLDSLDTGFASVSASELRVKMKSRQAIWEAVGRKNVDFNKTDEQVNICAAINQISYNTAMRLANKTSLVRFIKHGKKMIMGKDLGPFNAGPLWIWNPMQYNEGEDGKGNKIVTVQSPMLYTATTFPVKSIAGMHYCKLLSPARAMEWIYIDSLRK